MPENVDILLKRILKKKKIDNLSKKNCDEWDSIRQMEIIMELEENYNIQLSQKEISELTSVRKIKEKLKKYI